METLTAEDFIRRGKMLEEMLISLIQQGKVQDILIDLPYVREVQAESRAEGRAEGREEGREEGLEKGHQAMSDTLHRILRAKGFQVKPGLYQQFFDNLSLEDLEQLSEVALQADTLADFEAALDAILQEK